MNLTTIEATYFAKKIKDKLIEMAIEGELPMDMNEFDYSIILNILLDGEADETDGDEDWTSTEMIGI